MNTPDESNAVQSAPRPPLPSTPYTLRPMEGRIHVLSVIEALLKEPGRVLYACTTGVKVPLLLLAAALACLGVFGFLLGTFSGGVQLWAAPLKITGGAFAAMLICLPSLYIFSALGGAAVRIGQVAVLLLAMMALTGLLLLGFAPVAWVFSQSTESEEFMGALALVFWLIALFFGGRLLVNGVKAIGMATSGYLHLWLCIFVVVTLQMSTSLRPLIGNADTLLPTEKRFFLEHWMMTVGVSGAETRTATAGSVDPWTR